MTMKPYSFHGRFFSANGSFKLRLEPGGSFAICVSDLPNGTLIRALAFTAQPFASRIGPRFRLRSFMYARINDGPEMTRRIPRITSGICHDLRSTTFAKT